MPRGLSIAIYESILIEYCNKHLEEDRIWLSLEICTRWGGQEDKSQKRIQEKCQLKER